VGFEVFLEFQRFELIGKAQYQTNSQGLNLAVCVDFPVLWSDIRRFKSAVAPVYSWSGNSILRMM
jgi:hypothetical protein